jgi:hypothetical protein
MFGLTGLAALGFVLKAFVGEEELFASGKDELRPAVDAFEGLIAVFHAWLPRRNRCSPAAQRKSMRTSRAPTVHPCLSGADSFLLVSNFLSAPFPGQGFLDSAFFPRFQIEGMFLDLLDDVFLLNLPLEATQRVL